MSKSLYRCVASRRGWYDTEMDVGHSYINGFEYKRYDVVKETEKGYWIARGGSGWPVSWIKNINHKECRFVLKGKGKRFASETKEQAFHNLMRRTYSRRDILEQQTKDNETLIQFIEAEMRLREQSA